MNKVILIGRLTKNVELRYSQINNVPVASFTLAVNRRYVKTGEERQTDFINIIAWNNLAQTVYKYLSKGMQTAVTGRLEIRKYEDQQGKVRYITEVIAEDIDFIDSKKGGLDETILFKDNNGTSDICTSSLEFDDGDDLPF